MNKVINEIIEIVKKNNIKVITISESNHRSYTCHTFNFKLMKALYENKLINIFSTEKLGIFESMVINYHLKKKLNLDKIEKGGIGSKRWINYLKDKDYNSYKLVGLEFDEGGYTKISKKLLNEFFSKEFVEDYIREEDPKKLRTKLKNDKLVKESLIISSKFFEKREEFWLKNIKKILDKENNLFIVGFHLTKDDIIGKYIKEKYKNQSMIIGLTSYRIKTQVLIIDENKYPNNEEFNNAIKIKDYKQKLMEIDNYVSPTKYEKSLKNKFGDWKLIKVDKNNKDKKIRTIGCYIGMTKKEFEDKKKIKSIDYNVGNFDYIVFFDKSSYRENMFE